MASKFCLFKFIAETRHFSSACPAWDMVPPTGPLAPPAVHRCKPPNRPPLRGPVQGGGDCWPPSLGVASGHNLPHSKLTRATRRSA